MALPKLFQRIFWHNDTTPALNEDNLNAMSKAIDDIDDRVIQLGGDALEAVPQIQQYLTQADGLVESLRTISTYPPYIGNNGNWWVWNNALRVYEDSGVDASISVGIDGITMIDFGEQPYVENVGTDTDPRFHLYLPKAPEIMAITKEYRFGRMDVYRVTLQDSTYFNFDVTNGEGMGDMLASDYDPSGEVINSGGIPSYIAKKLQGDFVSGLGHSIGSQSSDFPIHVEGINSTVDDNAHCAHVEGSSNYASGTNVHAEGSGTSAIGFRVHAEGEHTKASGNNSHAEGYLTIASGNNSHAEGRNTNAIGDASHATGWQTTASGTYSHAEGSQTCASGMAAHAEGLQTCASGEGAHAVGFKTSANADYSFAAGQNSVANVPNSMAIGYEGKAGAFTGNSAEHQHDRLFAIGGGEKAVFKNTNEDWADDIRTTKNVLSVDKFGNMFLRGFPYLTKGVLNNRLLANGDSFVLEDGAAYLLFTTTRMANNGAWRGMQAYYITTGFMPNLTDGGISTSANAVPTAHQFSTAGTAGVTLQRTAVSYDDNGTTKWHGKLGIGSCVANCCVRYSLLKVVGSEADFATKYVD